MHATRQAILETLRDLGRGTAGDLAESLDIKPPSLRYHLLHLEESGFIERVSLPSTGSVGRPAVHYGLTATGVNEAQPGSPWLVRGLLDQMTARFSPEQTVSLFTDLGRQLARDFVPVEFEELPAQERLDLASKALASHGYGVAARQTISADDGELVLRTLHCPFGDLPQEHSELCEMDVALVSELMGQPCSHEQNLALGDDCCTFHVAGTKSAAIELS